MPAKKKLRSEPVDQYSSLKTAFGDVNWQMLTTKIPNWEKDLSGMGKDTLVKMIEADAGFFPKASMVTALVEHFNALMSGLSDARTLISPSNMFRVPLTSTKLLFVGRTICMQAVETAVNKIQNLEQRRLIDDAKGQPIIGTGATTGVGKSRLLEEIRKHYESLSYVVIVVTYNSGADFLPTQDEYDVNDLMKVERCFLSRLLFMMLPQAEFNRGKANLSTHFTVDLDEVVCLLAEKFAGKNILILMDEVVALGNALRGSDDAMHKVISTLGHLADRTTSKLAEADGGKSCVAIFTALSEGIVAKARTNSSRVVLSVELPLLSRKDVETVVKAKYPKANDVVVEHIFAMTAGHARTLERFLLLEWDEQGSAPKHLTTLEGLLTKVCTSSTGTLNDQQIRAVLLEDSKAANGTVVDFQELSRQSIVHVSRDSVILVPAFLFQWAATNLNTSRLARHIHACLTSAWHRIFLSDKKEGDRGDTLEHFLWHFEAVRRELVEGKAMSVPEFYRFGLEKPTPLEWKWNEEYTFPCITVCRNIRQPAENRRKNFSVKSIIVDSRTRYEPASSNFPKYDWLTGMVSKSGTVVAKGEQSKHGSGKVQPAADDVASVKLSTKTSGLESWEKQGWLVLGGQDLRRYLGSTMTALAACALYLPDRP